MRGFNNIHLFERESLRAWFSFFKLGAALLRSNKVLSRGGHPVKIAWWNTGLSPVVQPRRGSKPQKSKPWAIAEAVVCQLLGDVDLLLLGEVCEADVERLHKEPTAGLPQEPEEP